MTLDDLYKRFLNHLQTGVLVLDGELRLHYLNVAAESLLAISDRKARELTLQEILVDGEQDILDIRNALRSNHSLTKRRSQLRLAQGRTLLVDYSVTPFDDHGEPCALLELQSLEHARRIDREESLKHVRATTQELVRGLAHEIKNPLGGIRGAAQLLSREIDSESLGDYTDIIIQEADRLHKLVDRMMGSRKPLEIEAVNIHEVLERVRHLVQAEASQWDIRLEKDYDPSIPPVDGDPEQLIQALLNLVRNALQALSENADSIEDGHITIRTRILRGVMIGDSSHRIATAIEVHDNGPGIPPALKDTIFYPMVSGRPAGTGLGLPIAHGIISQHNGLIECMSVPGDTRFTVVLPLTCGHKRPGEVS